MNNQEINTTKESLEPIKLAAKSRYELMKIIRAQQKQIEDQAKKIERLRGYMTDIMHELNYCCCQGCEDHGNIVEIERIVQNAISEIADYAKQNRTAEGGNHE